MQRTVSLFKRTIERRAPLLLFFLSTLFPRARAPFLPVNSLFSSTRGEDMMCFLCFQEKKGTKKAPSGLRQATRERDSEAFFPFNSQGARAKLFSFFLRSLFFPLVSPLFPPQAPLIFSKKRLADSTTTSQFFSSFPNKKISSTSTTTMTTPKQPTALGFSSSRSSGGGGGSKKSSNRSSNDASAAAQSRFSQ